MKIVYSGLESSGKSLLISRDAQKILNRNASWFKITKIPRTMAFNMPMSEKFKKDCKKAGVIYFEWKDYNEIEYLTDADIFIDELLKIFPSRGSDPLPANQMDFLTQGAKSGIQIRATSQDFSQVHKQFRLLTNKVYMVRKIIGSQRPMKTAPPVNQVWGICIKQSVKPSSFRGDTATMENDWLPMPFTIRQKDVMRYDTLYKVPRSTLPDLKLRAQRVFHINQDGEEYVKTQFK
jgi:hypothetical protein